MWIELEGVTKRFGALAALRGVSASVAEGSRVGLIGPNGSGKTTLTRVLMGIVACEGEVRIGGMSPFADRVRLARRLAYVPQIAPSLGATVADLAAAVSAARGMRKEEIAAFARRLDLDADAIGARPFRNLSGGMKQKLLIAMAMAARPALLIMDEPTASLDAAARRRFFELCGELPPETTLLLCSHRLEELQHLIDRVLVLEEGALVRRGPLAEFLERRATALFEARPATEAQAAWLREAGYARGAGGRWSRAVPRGEKEAEIARLSRELKGSLADLLVRDVETVAPASGPEGDA